MQADPAEGRPARPAGRQPWLRAYCGGRAYLAAAISPSFALASSGIGTGFCVPRSTKT
jgi:hypothetical protein